MKRIFAFILSAVLTGCLCSCSNTPQASPSMYIEPAQLSEEENQIAELLGADKSQRIFDFVVDDTVQSYQVNTYQLIDGRWELQNGGGGSAFTDTSGRIALGFDKLAEGIRVAAQSEHSGGSTIYKRELEPELIDMGYATAYLSNKTEIIYEEEIPLVIQVMTSKGQIISYDVEYFKNPEEYEKLDYEGVFAVTVRFSQNPVS